MNKEIKDRFSIYDDIILAMGKEIKALKLEVKLINKKLEAIMPIVNESQLCE